VLMLRCLSRPGTNQIYSRAIAQVRRLSVRRCD
jgi:hypothetical protein